MSAARRPGFRLSARGRHQVALIIHVGAVIGLVIGLGAFAWHLLNDPLADVHAYYDAGARLNAGQPLYAQAATTNDADFYRYPPLLAIAFRPLAMLPFPIAAGIWESVVVAATLLTLGRIVSGRPRGLALGILAMPILWTVAIGQAQALVTLGLASGSPLGVALAGNLKLTPYLVAVYWVARREWRPLVRLAGWTAVLVAVQVVLEPAGSVAFLGFSSFSQVGEVRNLSPYAVSPILWGICVAALGLLAWRLAPGRWGWAAAVVLAVGITPRLLAYQLSSLLAMLGGPSRSTAVPGTPSAGEP